MSGDLRTINAIDLAMQQRWSEQTFGPGLRTAGHLDHIAKEMEEVRRHPEDLREWVDILILALGGALRVASAGEVIAVYHAKMLENRQRQWPDWRTEPEGQAIEHVRDAP